MPYIDRQHRCEATRECPETVGELNFAITTLVHDYIERKGLSYGTLNSVVGVLECAKLELYRRVAAPYEDKKIAENGDLLPRNAQ